MENSPGEDVWYFAYGSNLSLSQKKKRTGVIRKARVARLPDYRLAFNKRGRDPNETYANLVSEKGAVTWGVIYRCSSAAIRDLDWWEGEGRHYERRTVQVRDKVGAVVEAVTYFACPECVCGERPPSRTYLNRIIQGAKEHGLPPGYIQEIRAHVEMLSGQGGQ